MKTMVFVDLSSLRLVVDEQGTIEQAADNTVEKVILPLRDGLTIIRKKTD